MADAVAEFKANNKLGTIRERYTKHAKALFQVGKPLTDDYKTQLGYKAEIFVDQNPGSVKVGDDMGIQVLFRASHSNQLVLSATPPGRMADATIPEISEYTLRTDENGRLFKITKADKWYIR
jgi:hypothetical protein